MLGHPTQAYEQIVHIFLFLEKPTNAPMENSQRGELHIIVFKNYIRTCSRNTLCCIHCQGCFQAENLPSKTLPCSLHLLELFCNPVCRTTVLLVVEQHLGPLVTLQKPKQRGTSPPYIPLRLADSSISSHLTFMILSSFG